MINPGINERASGFLVLLLTLLILCSLKLVFTRSRTQAFPCDEPSYAQIEGDIRFPGVYAFCHSPHLMELIGRAGGVSSDAVLPESSKDLTFTPGVRVIVRRDGDKYKIYQKEMSAFYKLTLGLPISLNRESEEGLTALPGIGLGLARAIVRERSKRGGFESLEEIVSINGIGHRLYDKIKPFLTL